MSKLRPTLGKATSDDPCPRNGTAYMMILSAVRTRRKLIHGALRKNGEFCAIGSYFEVNKGALPSALIDEITLVNDSVPHFTPSARKAYVVKWLKWKLQCLGLKS